MAVNRHRSPIEVVWSCNRQYGLGNYKYVVILDPLPTGHVARSMRSKLLAYNMGANFRRYNLRNGAR